MDVFVRNFSRPVKWPHGIILSNYNELWDLGVFYFHTSPLLNFGSSVSVHKATALDDLLDIWARLLLFQVLPSKTFGDLYEHSIGNPEGGNPQVGAPG